MASAAQGGGALVLSGEPGIGKTILWEAGVEEAAARGYRVLAHRSVEAEAGLAFTGLADLLTPVLDDVHAGAGAPATAGTRGGAAAGGARRGAAGSRRDRPRAHGRACARWRTSADVVVAIDDIQWLDSSTAAVLPLALRRLDRRARAHARDAARRPGVSAPFELARTFGRLEELSLDPLGISELHRLLADRLGLELSRPELTRVLETSGGNPFFALEIGRELDADSRGAIRVPASLREALAAGSRGCRGRRPTCCSPPRPPPARRSS